MRASRTPQAGFSLLELVVAVGLLTLIMGVVFDFVLRSQKDFAANQALAEAHENADFAMLRVTELLRVAGANPANIPSINKLSFLQYTTAGDQTSVNLLSDLDGNGSSGDNVEGSTAVDSRYYILSSENVTLRHNANAQTIELVDNTTGGSNSIALVEHIRSFQVEILQNSREARVTITAGPSAGTISASFDPTFTVVSEVRLRNRF